MSRFSLRLLFPVSVALVLLVGAVFSFTTGFNTARAQQPAAAYAHGRLSVSIPYHSTSSGAGRLTAEILDPEDHVLGRVERTVYIAKGGGVWKQAITPDHPIGFDVIIWQRLRYRFEYNDAKVAAIEGVESISQILRRPVVHILGQTEYLAGSRAAIRVIVSDANKNDVAESGEVRIDLLAPEQKSWRLFSGRLNRRGTLEAQFRFPAGLTGKYEMRYVADTPIGSTEYTQPVQLTDQAAILLTTEKPIYQPGQTIHIRALALARADHKAEADRKLLFEMEDSHGNKVFKSATVTDSFGIASAEFSLADEVNLGTYHLRALMGDAGAPSSKAEIGLNVENYVLPKFKVAIEFTEKDHKPKRYYQPRDHVTGTVRANYFFGKPVDHADITIKASGQDVAVFEAASGHGKTDDEGCYRFDLPLPEYFAGHPLSQGAARGLIEATVKDSAGHAETRREPITISDSALLITAVPEGGNLIPHLDNEVFVISSYPDGTPAATDLTVHIHGARDQQVSSDGEGVAVIHFNPDAGVESLGVDADDHRGSRVATNVPLQTRAGPDQVLVRTNRAVLKTGETMELKVLSTRARGSAYIDVVKNGQTILTRDLELRNGEADLALTATSEMAGTLDVDAYVFGKDAQPVADHRLVFVQPADELKIETKSDSAVYAPGSEARISFHVTNAHGEGVSAALGLQVVDEAVFALAEKQPGFAKVFFYLEQEVMKPRYEIHSLSVSRAVEPMDVTSNRQQDLEARALFAATEMTVPAKLDTEFGRSLPQDRYAEYQERYEAVFAGQVKAIAAKLNESLAWRRGGEDFIRSFGNITIGNLRDAWNTPLRIEPTGGRDHFYRVRSAGPDKQFGNADDLIVYLKDRSGSLVSATGRGGKVDLKIEHDRRAVNEDAELTGAVMDASGAFIPGSDITLTPGARSARAGNAGQFTFSALPPGHYRVEIEAPGFGTVSRNFTLRARDRGVLSVVLWVGNSTETVEVTGAANAIQIVETGRSMIGLGGRAVFGARAAMLAADRVSADAVPMAARSFSVDRKKESSAAPHIRSYFPEALYINPEIITDASGNASISIPVADSITTWRMALFASTESGALGSGVSSIKVFQDFFVDLDLPVTLTQGDRVSIPIAAYNYSGRSGRVSLHLQPEDWFSLDGDSLGKTVSVESGGVGASQFTVTANRIGKFKLTLSARMDGGGSEAREDVVVREIEVIPNGREQDIVFNGRLDSPVQHDLDFPAGAIPDASSILVRLYPGPLSQVIEGMDSILTMPNGCFEQTSSSTYPNVLALDYMKRTKKLTPEVHAKAEGYIANGYQRLLTFEVPGGGFSWFGQAPANKILTAYGLMEFNDMSKVSDVDPKLIERTGDWLAGQQHPDGSWKPDTAFINEGATNRYNSDVLRITAYIAWSLANTGYQGPAVEKAKQFLEAHANAKADSYTLAIIANVVADSSSDRDSTRNTFIRKAMLALLDARSENGDMVSWTADESAVYSTGSSAAIETTGLATQALLKWGEAPETVRKALNFISSNKQAAGNWGTTQATVMALRALLLASQGSGPDVRGVIHVAIDGKPVETLKLMQENNDLLHQFVFKGIDGGKPASVQLAFKGKGGVAYQVVGRYFTPWEEKPASEPLSIDIAYDRTRLARNDIATATATVRSRLHATANMVMVDLGIPPGFELLSEDLQAFQEKTAGAKAGALEKFSLTATQAILYFNALSPMQTVTLRFRLRAKYPIRARTFQSRVYEYYDPDVKSIAPPVRLEVTEH